MWAESPNQKEKNVPTYNLPLDLNFLTSVGNSCAYNGNIFFFCFCFSCYRLPYWGPEITHKTHLHVVCSIPPFHPTLCIDVVTQQPVQAHDSEGRV